MEFKKYQEAIKQTSIYPLEMGPSYPALGLAGECGEVCDKIKKTYRDKNGVFDDETKKNISKELGDVLWYLAALCNSLELDFDDVAKQNIEKIFQRKERNTLHGDGDDR